MWVQQARDGCPGHLVGGSCPPAACRCHASLPLPCLRRRALLEAVKQLKLQELEAAGVPKKYHAQVGAQVDGHKRHA